MVSQRKPASKRKPISRRKLAANRRNARKSTGPKTAEGKRIVSRNGLIHGLRSSRWPVLPFEDENEYREFALSVERDYRPAGIVQRELVAHITQLLWKLRRIPAIEQAMLQNQRLELEQSMEQAQLEGEVEEDAVLEPATTAKLLAVDFASEDGGRYERLENHRGRLERGLHAAMRQLKKSREETCGEELSKPQQAAYEMQELDRLIDEVRESRDMAEAVEAMKTESADGKAAPTAGRGGPAEPNSWRNDGSVGASPSQQDAAPRDPAKRSLSSKANAGGEVDKHWQEWEKREGEVAPKSAERCVGDPNASRTAEANRGTEEESTADERG